MIEDYLAELDRELASVGIRRRVRARILAESEDHLRSDPERLDRFGGARALANSFASELGARASRRAAVGAFAALGVAGAVFAVSFVGASFAHVPPSDAWPLLAALVFPAIIVAPQVAFVAGSLALLRTLRRRERVLPSAELSVINRRTGLALLAGLVTMAAVAIFALELRNVADGWWVLITLMGSAAAGLLIVLAAIPTAGAARLRPSVAGEAGDVFDDLGLAGYRDDPWRFARWVALGVGLAVWIAGVVQGDPIDGALQGFAEALACLGGFAVLGRFLGLRR
jgi:MFS family permease